MRTLIFIGRSGCGKTTLLQRLQGEPLVYQKTQSIALCGNIIDTPGEYMEHKKMFRALVVTCVDAELAVLVQDCRDSDTTFFPGMQSILNMPMVGVVTKTDLAQPGDIQRAEALLDMAGAERKFHLSAYDGAGIRAFLNFLEEEDAGIER